MTQTNHIPPTVAAAFMDALAETIALMDYVSIEDRTTDDFLEGMEYRIENTYRLQPLTLQHDEEAVRRLFDVLRRGVETYQQTLP